MKHKTKGRGFLPFDPLLSQQTQVLFLSLISFVTQEIVRGKGIIGEKEKGMKEKTDTHI